VPALDGKLLRPLAAYLLVPREKREGLNDRFWFGALAIEMVHEASLLHDDILDEALQRRGRPTMAAEAGVGPALVMGDHLLTAAYRSAAAAESPRFLQTFIKSVERTVAGEVEQERSQGRVLPEEEYVRIITGKSGELFRSAYSLAATAVESQSEEGLGSLGAQFGALYQMVDDFLDYCTQAERGKAPLQDLRQKKWTWPLGLIGVVNYDTPVEQVLSALFRPGADGSPSPMEKGAQRLGREFGLLLEDLSDQGLETVEIAELFFGWHTLVLTAAKRETAAQRRLELGLNPTEPIAISARDPAPFRAATIRRELREAAEGLHDPGARLRYFGHHAKSFRFAARLFPQDRLQQVADVYAFCRFTDDLVDEADAEDIVVTEARLDLWLSMAKSAYEGKPSSIAFLDDVMTTMAGAEVPFSYVEELIEGVRMDLRPRTYHSLDELRVYSYRVASVVGGWLTELFGIRDPWVLERAYALGHAMQLTNILRDVGEDLAMGRLYLPEDLMARCGVDRTLLEAKAQYGGPMFPGHRHLVETLMDVAEADYDKAFEAMPALPGFFQGPTAVAASVYRGIHEEIRKNEYDNLHRRASTSLIRKVALAMRGILTLARSRSRWRAIQRDGSVPRPAFRRTENQRAAS
jgi:phytoene synthase